MTQAFLIIVTWIQAGSPLVSVTPLESMHQCHVAKQGAVAMVQAQAASNLVGTHKVLRTEQAEGADSVALRTQAAGREIARLQCVSAATPSAQQPPRHR